MINETQEPEEVEANEAPQEEMAEGQDIPPTDGEGMQAPEDAAELGPGQQMQLEAYRDNATLAVYSEKTQPAILQSLQSSKNPVEAVARTAFMVHRRLEASMKNEKMTEITMALGAGHLVSELINLAEAAKLFKLSNEDRLSAYQHAVRLYFEDGMASGRIDPIELQKTIEPLMNREQREYGEQMMVKHGISRTPPPSGKVVKGNGILARR